jgi:hypothetical protein
MVIKRLADLLDAIVQSAFKIYIRVCSPQCALNLLSRHDLARVPDEQRQHLGRLMAQADTHPVLAQLQRADV